MPTLLINPDAIFSPKKASIAFLAFSFALLKSLVATVEIPRRTEHIPRKSTQKYVEAGRHQKENNSKLTSSRDGADCLQCGQSCSNRPCFFPAATLPRPCHLIEAHVFAPTHAWTTCIPSGFHGLGRLRWHHRGPGFRSQRIRCRQWCRQKQP
jgi:hypothetical protein